MNPIIEELKAMANFDWPEYQKDYFVKMAADAKPVQCVSIREVFTLSEIRIIEQVLQPKAHQCYRNAALLTELFPGRVKYVEGFGWDKYFKIDHAFNRVGDKYIDITWEMVLKENVNELPYVSLIEADSDALLADICAHNNITGDYYRHKYIEGLGGLKAVAQQMDERALYILENSDSHKSFVNYGKDK